MHTSSIIHYPAACASRASVARVCALARRAYARKRARSTARRHLILHACRARRRKAILEHASPDLGSGRSGARARPGALGGAGCWMLILPGGVGRGVLISAPKHPCKPCPSEPPSPHSKSLTRLNFRFNSISGPYLFMVLFSLFLAHQNPLPASLHRLGIQRSLPATSSLPPSLSVPLSHSP